jgi:polyhydroxyalkanoate synthesis regulator phasin
MPWKYGVTVSNIDIILSLEAADADLQHLIDWVVANGHMSKTAAKDYQRQINSRKKMIAKHRAVEVRRRREVSHP